MKTGQWHGDFRRDDLLFDAQRRYCLTGIMHKAADADPRLVTIGVSAEDFYDPLTTWDVTVMTVLIGLRDAQQAEVGEYADLSSYKIHNDRIHIPKYHPPSVRATNEWANGPTEELVFTQERDWLWKRIS